MEKGGEGEASGGAKAAVGVPRKRQRSNCRRAEGSPRHYGFSHQNPAEKGHPAGTEQTERRNVFDADTVERTQPFTPTAEQAAALSALHRELEAGRKKGLYFCMA